MRFFAMRTALAALAAAVLLAGGPAALAEDPGWGTIKGQVVFAGDKIPAPEKLEVTKDQEHCLGKGPIYSQDVVINPKNKGLRYVFVWLIQTPDNKDTPIPIHPKLQNVKLKDATIDQPKCAFVPHSVALREGQNLVVKNSAPINHNVNWIGDQVHNLGGNVLVAASGSYTIKGLKAQRLPLPVKCTIHPWMSGWCGVYKHPYFAVTDENGDFEIKDAPAGKYHLMVWLGGVGYLGGKAGRNGQPITVKAAGVTDLGKLGMKK